MAILLYSTGLDHLFYRLPHNLDLSDCFFMILSSLLASCCIGSDIYFPLHIVRIRQFAVMSNMQHANLFQIHKALQCNCLNVILILCAPCTINKYKNSFK